MSPTHKRLKTVFTAFAFGLLLLAGCGGSGDSVVVSGTVRYQGEPVERATVKFFPLEEGGRSCVARTDSNGEYQLAYSRNEDAIPKGEYAVTIVAMAPDPNAPPQKTDADGQPIGPRKMIRLIPEKFGLKKTSELTATVASGDGAVHDFDLQ